MVYRENDGTGLYYFRARYYSSTLSRFISEDPIGLRGGMNTYAYVRNNPLRWTDPLGLSPGDLFATPGDAAADASQYGRSLPGAFWREFCGFIFKKDDGCYTYGVPDQGNAFTCRLFGGGPNVGGWWHNHPGWSGPFGGNSFSGADKGVSDGLGAPGFLGRPSGGVLQYDPSTGNVSNVKPSGKKCGCSG